MEVHHFVQTDAKTILSQLKHHDKIMQHKRRWLLGLDSYELEPNKSKRESVLETRSLPESIIREDDMFYDTVKSCVEEAFGIRGRDETLQRVVLDDLEMPDMPDLPRAVLACVNNMTIKGLSLLAEVLTRGQTLSEKTRWKMKKIVRKLVFDVFHRRKSNRDYDLKAISGKITRILHDPQNFLDNRVPFVNSRALVQRSAAIKVLEVLGKFSVQTLMAMDKRLKNVKPSMPQLEHRRTGGNRDRLIKQVTNFSLKMLLATGKEDQLPEPLMKAMAVAALSMKLMPGFHNSTTMEFSQFLPEIEVVQNDIIKAIWLVRRKVEISELQIVKNLLDPNAKVSKRGLRPGIRKMLIEYLYGCDDMDTVPQSLLKALTRINKKSQNVPDILTLKNVIDEEIECILNVSAQMKQNVLDLFPVKDFEADFNNAYMEDLEDSDDEFDCMDNKFNSEGKIVKYDDDGDDSSQNSCFNEEVESTGDSVAANRNPTTAINNTEETWLKSPGEGPKSSLVSFKKPKETSGYYKNQYLAIQEAGDETSMIAYNLIGCLLEEFGCKEGLDLEWFCSLYLKRDFVNEDEDSEVAERKSASRNESDGDTIVRVTEELLPSFPKSGIERLKMVLDSS